MTKYCSECGKNLDDENSSFCPHCGANLNENVQSQKNNKILVLAIIGVTLLIITLIIGFGLSGESTSILIISESPISNSGNFTVELTDGEQAISGKVLHITFKNNQNSYEYSGTTNNAGLVNIIPNIENGDYEVTVTFDGDNTYKKSSTKSQMTVETRITEIDSQVTSTRTEPDYESFSYTHSFEDTDKNGDGYVYLSDMNIAHTPEYILNQMFADSDSNGDGRLNHDEYYKFMYKLNYDRSSYGL